ncbi:3-hydroxyacyl-CoA dehydrogenase family protein [Chloroflexota bacterium]
MGLENIKQVTVIGAGNMGSGIAGILSRLGGYQVIMCDTTNELVQSGLQNQRNNLQRFFVDKQKITADEMETILGRIKTTTNTAEAVSQSDFVIEAIFESMELKKSVFKQIDGAAPPHTILASNTSYLSITEMANETNRPDKVAGMHFFNPPAVMKLVEVVRAPLTSEETGNTVYAMAQKLGKEPIYCRDTYGFLANRCAGGTATVNDALELLWAHIATPEDIDKAVKLGYNRPMGPLELFDTIGGWGLYVRSEEERIREFGWDIGHVHPLMKMMVRAGYTGGIGQKGVYDFWRDALSTW